MAVNDSEHTDELPLATSNILFNNQGILHGLPESYVLPPATVEPRQFE